MEPPAEIPNRAAFKASEVCEIAGIPPYVLRSWEKEFPGLGSAARPGGARIYRRSDVQQVLRIKQLVFADGLTLAGAHRKLEGEPAAEDEGLPEPLVPEEVRAKIARAKTELRSLLEMLSAPRPAGADAAPPAESERQADLPLGREADGSCAAPRRTDSTGKRASGPPTSNVE